MVPPGEPEAAERPASPSLARVVGLRFDPIDRQRIFKERAAGLLQVLGVQLRRRASAAAKVELELRGFDDAEAHQRAGEALLAGVRQAESVHGALRVPDPWEPGAWVEVKNERGLSATALADREFQKHRRAERGRRTAEARLQRLRDEIHRLGALRERYAVELEESDAPDETLAALEAALRREGIPVGIVAPTKAGRAHHASRPTRIEGVRLSTSSDGWEILIGRSARENQRLTFKLAGPEDFWLHALGVTGAHVVVRNPTREKKPPQATLREAAAAAAWFSEARKSAEVDVQWTRRKYVRRIRGGAPGAVQVKRFETLRVRPDDVDRNLREAPGA